MKRVMKIMMKRVCYNVSKSKFIFTIKPLCLLTTIHRCINIIGQVITLFLQDASEAMGWVFYILGEV